jgi:hypothetical protein
MGEEVFETDCTDAFGVSLADPVSDLISLHRAPCGPEDLREVVDIDEAVPVQIILLEGSLDPSDAVTVHMRLLPCLTLHGAQASAGSDGGGGMSGAGVRRLVAVLRHLGRLSLRSKDANKVIPIDVALRTMVVFAKPRADQGVINPATIVVGIGVLEEQLQGALQGQVGQSALPREVQSTKVSAYFLSRWQGMGPVVVSRGKDRQGCWRQWLPSACPHEAIGDGGVARLGVI